MKYIEIEKEIFSGRKFKRSIWRNYIHFDSQLQHFKKNNYGPEIYLIASDLLAGDWELEPISKNLTKQDLEIAWNGLSRLVASEVANNSTLFQALCDKLGF